MMDPWLVPLLLAGVAFAYAMVGHGGASGYLALLTLIGYAAGMVKPSALLLNLLVSSIAFVQFARAGHFRWNTFWPFALGSVPAAWFGARLHLDPLWYQRVLGCLLLFAVARMLWPSINSARDPEPMNVPLAIGLGALLGLVSGMIGIGGGIILSPLLLLLHWADVRTTAATSALFIFVNSASGLASLDRQGGGFNEHLLLWAGAAAAGGVLGAWIGSRRLPSARLRQALGIVLFFAAVKLIFAV